MTEATLGSSELEVSRAIRLLKAAGLLVRHGFYEDAVSRAYYSVFHAACALLASIGRTVWIHERLRTAIALHFVKPGRLDAKYSRVLARTATVRNDAVYGAISTFRLEDAERTLQDAKDFLAAVTTLLTDTGSDGAMS